MDAMRRAALFAERKHRGQKRKYTFEPYFEHCKRVARRVEDMGGSESMICAAYLHDTIEDCDCSFSEIVFEFGKDIAGMVLELTNPTHFGAKKIWNRNDRKEYQRITMAGVSIEAKVIKCFDLQDNLFSITKHDKTFADVFVKESRLLVRAMMKPIKLPYEISLFFQACKGLEQYLQVFNGESRIVQ